MKRSSVASDYDSRQAALSSQKSLQSSANESELNKKMAELEEKYELMTVDSILDGILNKQFDQNKHVMNNLGFKSDKPNQSRTMVNKMELRHQELAKKRENRIKKNEQTKKDFEMTRETEIA